MSDSLAERLKQLAGQHADDQQAEEDALAFQARVNQFISSNADGEFARLQDRLKLRIDEVNLQLGDLPKFALNQGSRYIEQGNCMAGLHFDKPIMNMASNRLLISIGTHPNAMYFYDSDRPAPVRYELQAAATDNLDGMVWIGDLGEITTEELADIILENLTTYYLENKPGSRR